MILSEETKREFLKGLQLNLGNYAPIAQVVDTLNLLSGVMISSHDYHADTDKVREVAAALSSLV